MERPQVHLPLFLTDLARILRKQKAKEQSENMSKGQGFEFPEATSSNRVRTTRDGHHVIKSQMRVLDLD